LAQQSGMQDLCDPLVNSTDFWDNPRS
jgi:hypothetical protein